MNVSWAAIPHATGYVVRWRGTGSGGEAQVAAPATSYAVEGLRPGVTYTYEFSVTPVFPRWHRWLRRLSWRR